MITAIIRERKSDLIFEKLIVERMFSTKILKEFLYEKESNTIIEKGNIFINEVINENSKK